MSWSLTPIIRTPIIRTPIISNDNNVLNIGGKTPNEVIGGKYIVFDVDETLGYFSQFGAFMDALSFYYKDFSISIFEKFNEILDLYPEFIRTNMIDILKYINHKKNQGTCSGIFIYTNNQGPRTWVQHIAKYFEYKVSGGEGQLFDKIIGAYKINGKVIEIGRTSQNKTYDDLLRITCISQNLEICFVEDLNHPDMRNPKVLYLNVKPYVKTISSSEFIRRYLKSALGRNIASYDVKRFTDTVNERMGSISKKIDNIENIKINLNESNYISLNTPGDDTSKEDIENKNTGGKLFNYIKLFLKTKQYSNKGTKNNNHHVSQTRRHYRVRQHHHSNVSATRKYKKNNRISNSIHHDKKKTRRVGRFMRI